MLGHPYPFYPEFPPPPGGGIFRDFEKWPLNRGWPLKRGSTVYKYFLASLGLK